MPSCAHRREKETRCHWRQQDRCHKRNLPKVRFFEEILPIGTKFRTVYGLVAPYRAGCSTLHGDTQGPDIPATVERSQRDRVFARGERAKINGVNLVAAVSNSVIGKDR